MNKEKIDKINKIELQLNGLKSQVEAKLGLIVVSHASHYQDSCAELHEQIEFRRSIETQIRNKIKDPNVQVMIIYDPNL